MEERSRRIARLALDLDLAAEAVLRLRRPADVALDRHARLDERLDDPGGADPALDLHRLRAAVLHEPTRVLGRLVAAEKTYRDRIHTILIALVNQAECFRVAALACFDGPVIDDVFAHQQSDFRRRGPPVSSIFARH